MAGRIEDYGIIGDLQTVALVSRHGCIDWLCFPRFDSGAIFASLLGNEENGHWTMQPEGEFRSPGRRYRGDTLVLETDFETPSGAARLVDFMPPRGEAPDVVRIVEGVRGTVDFRMELVLRFDYGSIVPWVLNVDGALVGVAGPDAVCVRTPIELEGRNLRTYAEFQVREGERVPFVLTWFPSHRDLPEPVDAEAALADTLEYWSHWAGNCTLEGRWRDAVMRSLLTLKALTYGPTGGIVAAATTSLPEAARRRAQLGLPLLLAAGCDADAARVPPCGIRRRGAAVAGLAAARDRRVARGPPDHVRRRRRAAPHRARASVALRATRAPARSASGTAHRVSTSSTSTARSSTPSTSRASRVSPPRTTRGD